MLLCGATSSSGGHSKKMQPPRLHLGWVVMHGKAKPTAMASAKPMATASAKPTATASAFIYLAQKDGHTWL